MVSVARPDRCIRRIHRRTRSGDTHWYSARTIITALPSLSTVPAMIDDSPVRIVLNVSVTGGRGKDVAI